MNIKCNYCGGMFDETLEKCPTCGAANSSVKRSTADQPTTIEELKDWYKSKGLPPYETTRFFIGENYKGARAFGIYKDERSDKFVVYKNKDTGDRAVRYEGTDEAYAVNELFMRLKQEILEQKARNTGIRTVAEEKEKEEAYKFFTRKDEHEEAKKEAYYYYLDQARRTKKNIKTILFSAGGVGIIVLIIVLLFSSAAKPETTPVYYGDSDNSSSSLGGAYSGTTYYNEKYTNTKSGEGYYKVGNDIYYHNGNDGYSWFVFRNNDWNYVEISNVPESLKYNSISSYYSYTPDWDTETRISDFSNTDAYIGTHHESSDYSYGSGSNYHSSDSWWSSSSDSSWDNDSSWSWSSSDSWDSGSTDWGSDW